MMRERLFLFDVKCEEAKLFSVKCEQPKLFNVKCDGTHQPPHEAALHIDIYLSVTTLNFVLLVLFV